MSTRNRLPSFVAASAIVVALVCTSGAARADHELIEGKLSACRSDGTVIGQVNACGKRWRLQSGEVEVELDGDLEVEIKGLVLDDPSTGESNGTADGVTQIVVSLVCGDATGTVAVESGRFALGKSGNAEFKTKWKLPAECAAPVVLIREVREGRVGGWLAVTGR
ncbi:MAG: hypothetical protein U1F52_08195 [Burkholderiales bacterium]